MKKSRLLIILLIAALTFTACSPRNPAMVSEENTMDYDRSIGATEEKVAKSEMSGSGDSSEPRRVEPEKVIVTINMNFQTTKFDESLQNINTAIAAVGGYVEDSQIEFGSGYYNANKTANMSIRVPKEKVSEFKNSLGEEVGTLMSESTTKSDVTKSYRDNETRLKVLQDKEARLRELLTKAETVENIIEIENSLSETITQIEIIKSDLQNTDDLVDYSTIYIYITEVKSVSTVETPATTFFERLKNALTGSLSSFAQGLGNLLITAIYALPYLLLLGLIILVIRFLVKKIGSRFGDFKKIRTKENKKEVFTDDKDNETR